jgi:dihydrofolate reductase
VIVSIIVAMDENGGIGLAGHVPWRLATDLKLFKQATMGHHLILGRKTYESICKPLPGRKMVVVTRQMDYQAPGCTVVHSIEEALDLARTISETEAFVGGGAEIYSQALPLADRMYLTRVHAMVETDTYFPEFDGSEWEVQERLEYPPGEGDEYGFRYEVWNRTA